MAGRHDRSGSSPTKIPPPGEIRKICLLRRLSTPNQAKDAGHLSSQRTGFYLPGGGAYGDAPVRAAGRKAVVSASPPASDFSSPTPAINGSGNNNGGSPKTPVRARAWPSSQGPAARAQRQAVEAVLLDAKNQQLRGYVYRLRAAWSPGNDPGHVDGAFQEYAGMQKAAMDLVRSLLGHPPNQRQACVARPSAGRHGSVEETIERLEMLSIGGVRDDALDVLSASFEDMGLSDDEDPRASRGRRASEVWIATICDWRAAVQKLLDSHRASLAVTYQVCEKDASPEAVERILVGPAFREEAIHRMRNSLNYKAFTTAPGYWPRYERRFQNYDCLKKAIDDIDRLLHWEQDGLGVEDGEQGARPVREYVIAPRGDSILEFANTDADDSDAPVLRFRVSSHMLSETSPLFARLFSEGLLFDPACEDDPDQHLRRRQQHCGGGDGSVSCCCCYCHPRAVTCADGTQARLYSMPQAECNAEDALAILLHAAHMHADRVPRAVSLARFVALAEACLRYACTSPLEVFVEHLWLPAWVHEAGGSRPDALLVVSYAFGLRRLFARVSKTAVLNVADEEELEAKPWPRKVKDRIWAVRNAKMAQVYDVCASAVQEYFPPPMGGHHPSPCCSPSTPADVKLPLLPPQQQQQQQQQPSTPHGDRASALRRRTLAQLTPDEQPPGYTPLFSLTSTPRCPKGSHACDAANLGWLLLVLNELHLVGAGAAVQVIMCPSGAPPPQSQPRRSLAQLLDALRCAPGPPATPGHAGGVCDPAPAFRAAVNDVYNSLVGLTLFEVDGRRHGWALSRAAAGTPQEVGGVPLGVLGVAVIREDGVGAGVGMVKRHWSAAAHEAAEGWGGGGEGAVERAGGVGRDLGLLRDERCGVFNGDDDPWEQRRTHEPAPAPALAFTPDEATCLRILSCLDTPGDLTSAALVSRTFYTAFKNNELALMRRLVRAHRRLTLSALVRGPRRSASSLFRSADDASGEAWRTSSPASVGGSSEAPDSGCVMTTEDDGDDGDEDDGNNEGNLRAEGRGPASAGDGDWGWGGEARASYCGMTEEEAHRILWPDQPPGAPGSDEARRGGSGSRGRGRRVWQQQQQQPRDGGSEKVLLSHVALVEEKTLVVVGDKCLREQHDRRVGILSG